MIKVIQYPSSNSPYILLLIYWLRYFKKVQTEMVYGDIKIYWNIVDKLFFPFALFFYRCRRYQIFHLHWVHFYIGVPLITKYLSYIYSLLILYEIKILGFKLIWTIHNITPHENITCNDPSLIKFIVTHSDGIILHSPSTLADIGKVANKDTIITVIPHGNFIDKYINQTNKSEARSKLNIPTSVFAYLFIGYIRPYKGIEQLISDFKRLSKSIKNIRLIIAGTFLNIEYKKKIQYLFPTMNISFTTYYISDDELQYYYNAADIVVLPYRKIITSGSGITSFSFGRPIIAPRIGSISDYPENTGIYYDPDDEDGLYNSMKHAVKIKQVLPKMGKNAYKYAETLTWENAAKKTVAVYESVLKRK